MTRPASSSFGATLFVIAALALGGCPERDTEAAGGAAPPAPAAPATPGATPPGAAPSGATPPPAAPAAGDARSVLLTAFRQASARKMRARATMVATGGPTPGTSTWIAEMAPPNIKRMQMTLPTGQQMHMLVAGERAWQRTSAAAPWVRLPFGMPAMANAQFDQMIASSLEAGETTVEHVGAEPLDGRPMNVYRIVSRAPGTSPGAPGGTVTGRTWIGTDGLAHKFEGELGAPTPAHITILYEYDDSIAIELPPG